MWELWKEPYIILGTFIGFEVIMSFSSKEKRSLKKSLLNIILSSLIVFLVSIIGYTIFN